MFLGHTWKEMTERGSDLEQGPNTQTFCFWISVLDPTFVF